MTHQKLDKLDRLILKMIAEDEKISELYEMWYQLHCETFRTYTDKMPQKIPIEENKEFPVYYNPLGAATDSTVYYEWKPGLQTYYPKEVHLTYK